jgi:hypothetical protein
MSLLSFNVGVEIGQVLVLLVLVPVLNLVFRHVVAERMGIIVLSAIVAHTAWHWMTERWDALRQYSLPVLGATPLLIGVRVALAIVVVASVAWFLRRRPFVQTTRPRNQDAR